jgi:ABC-type antimicrobial peptide transport system permease subunit
VDPATVVPAARRVLESLGRQFALRAETFEQRSSMSLTTERMIAILSSFFGGLALLLAAIGLYGLMSYAVSRRTSEIGLRMALGAQSGGVLALILKDAVWLVLAGLAIGIPAVLGGGRLISKMLFGVTGNDPRVILLSSAILLAVAVFAAYVPARSASRIDPMIALRSE